MVLRATPWFIHPCSSRLLSIATLVLSLGLGPQRATASEPTGLDYLEAIALEVPGDAPQAEYLREASWNGLAFEVLALPFPGGLLVCVEVDGPTLAQSIGDNSSDFEIAVLAMENESIVASTAESFESKSPDSAKTIWLKGLRYTTQLDLPAGEYSVRVAIRSFESGSFAARDSTVLIPGFDDSVPFVHPPFLARQRGSERWLPVKGRFEVDLSHQVKGEIMAPSARPVLVAGRRASGYVLGYRMPGSQGRVRLFKNGTAVTGAALSIGARQHLPDRLFEAIAIGFETPLVLPGDYELSVEFSPGVSSSRLPVVILQEGSRDRGLLWTDLRSRLTSQTDVRSGVESASPEDQKIQEEQKVEELEAKYREALSVVDRPLEASTLLLNLESSAVLETDSLELLQTAEVRVVEELAKKDIESLLPILMLHTDMYLIYRARQLFSLASAARSMSEFLAELYAYHGSSEGSRIVAARALANLAGHLQESNLPGNTRRLYRRALEFDPSNEAALLGLASSFERHAEYTDAVRLLETLVERHPQSAEGLIRLAFNLDRLGLDSRARHITESILALDCPEWIRSLAFQRLARLLIGEGQIIEAVSFLERARSEISDNQELTFLLVHAYDLNRDTNKARDLLASLASYAFNGESARKRYDSWPKASLAEVRSKLSEAAVVRQGLVPRALQAEVGVGQ